MAEPAASALVTTVESLPQTSVQQKRRLWQSAKAICYRFCIRFALTNRRQISTNGEDESRENGDDLLGVRLCFCRNDQRSNGGLTISGGQLKWNPINKFDCSRARKRKSLE
jgi:hypothetical protein